MSESDDLGGLGDLEEGDGELGGLDGEFDDGFDEMEGDDMSGGGGGNVDELEHRLDELENEVGSLSSTVNTVRNENEQISESVQEVEENVRKLLDIYEMVTRGVNPFADDVDTGMGMGGGMGEEDSSFGLFTDDDGEDEAKMDDDVTEADAEGFFDDDLVEEDDEFESLDDGTDDEALDASADDGGGGSSFDELKDEFESGEADWDEEGDDAEDMSGGEFDEFGEDVADDGFEDVAGEEFEDIAGDEDVGAEAGSVDTAGANGSTEPTDAAVGADDGHQPAGATPETGTAETAMAETTDQQAVAADQDAGKPYLNKVPGGIAADLIVVEWMEYLVSEVGVHGAREAVTYYETIDWITEEAADELDSYLSEFDSHNRGRLSIEQHITSLEFIDQLDGGDVGVESSAEFGGGELP